MRTRQISQNYRLDVFIVEQYGEYSEYLKSVIMYFNPRVNFLDLRVGDKILVPSDAEITSIRKIRGFYDLVRD